MPLLPTPLVLDGLRIQFEESQEQQAAQRRRQTAARAAAATAKAQAKAKKTAARRSGTPVGNPNSAGVAAVAPAAAAVEPRRWGAALNKLFSDQKQTKRQGLERIVLRIEHMISTYASVHSQKALLASSPPSPRNARRRRPEA